MIRWFRRQKKLSREEYVSSLRAVATPIAEATGSPVEQVAAAMATTDVQAYLVDRVVELRQRVTALQKLLAVRDAQLAELNEAIGST